MESASSLAARCGSDCESCQSLRVVEISCRRRAPVFAQRPQREICSVKVIAKVEDLGKTGGGPIIIPPRAVGALIPEKVLDAATREVRFDLPRCEQREQRPGRLRWRARTDTFQHRI